MTDNMFTRLSKISEAAEERENERIQCLVEEARGSIEGELMEFAEKNPFVRFKSIDLARVIAGLSDPLAGNVINLEDQIISVLRSNHLTVMRNNDLTGFIDIFWDQNPEETT